MLQVQTSESTREVVAFRRTLRTLDRCLDRVGPVPSAATNVERPANKNGAKRRSGLSSNARASMVLQGRYMGYMRQLKPRQKAQVRKIREAEGVRVAIQRAKALVG